MSLVRTVNPNGGVVYRRAVEEPFSNDHLLERTVDENSLPGYGQVILVKRPVRTRMQGVVGAGGLKPPATRLASG